MDITLHVGLGLYFVIGCIVDLGTNGYNQLICLENGVWVDLEETEMCCNGVREPKDVGKECCSDVGSFYYTTENICCESRITPKHITLPGSNTLTEQGCCNNRIFSFSTHFCCGGQLYERSEGTGYLCCGDDVIDSNTQICCRNEDDPNLVNIGDKSNELVCCGHLVMDSTTRYCSWDSQGQPVVNYKQEAQCGENKIDLTKKTCCLDEVYNTPYLQPRNPTKLNPESSCCGQTGYNPSSHRCCETNGVVIPISGQLHCCGSGSVDTRTHLCCNGQPALKKTQSDICCGSHTISPATQGCCGGHPFYTATHDCCQGVSSLPLEKGRPCCGGKELRTGQLCCDNNGPVNKSDPLDDKCCLKTNPDYEYVTYNSEVDACYQGGLVTRIAPNDRECSGKRYLPDKAVCCDNELHPFPVGQTLACCVGNDMSETVYNLQTQMCCRGTFHNLPVAEYECCGPTPYEKYKGKNPCKLCTPSQMKDPHLLCCEGYRYLKSVFGDACCGRKPYSSKRSTCCDGQLFDTPPEGKACCGKELYSPDRSTCCYGQLVHQPSSETLCSHPKGQHLDTETSTGSRLNFNIGSVLMIVFVTLGS